MKDHNEFDTTEETLKELEKSIDFFRNGIEGLYQCDNRYLMLSPEGQKYFRIDVELQAFNNQKELTATQKIRKKDLLGQQQKYRKEQGGRVYYYSDEDELIVKREIETEQYIRINTAILQNTFALERIKVDPSISIPFFRLND